MDQHTSNEKLKKRSLQTVQSLTFKKKTNSSDYSSKIVINSQYKQFICVQNSQKKIISSKYLFFLMF